jgi:uncharacterized protein (TIRG00374 family)
VKYLKLSLALALLVFLIWVTDPKSLLVSLAEVSPLEFMFLMLISFIMILVSALKWQLFLEALGGQVKIFILFKIYIVGYFVNTFIPSYIGGDAVRSYYIGKSVGQHHAFSATILERVTGLFAMFFLSLVAVSIEKNILTESARLFVSIASALVVFSCLSMAVASHSFLIKILRFFQQHLMPKRFAFINKIFLNLEKLIGLVFSLKSQPILWLKVAALSLLFHMLTVVNVYFCGQAVGWENISLLQLAVVLPIILVIGAIPITPAGLGIQEGAFYHYLQLLGATSSQALAVAVVLRAKSIVLAGIGWIIWIREGIRLDSNKTKH